MKEKVDYIISIHKHKLVNPYEIITSNGKNKESYDYLCKSGTFHQLHNLLLLMEKINFFSEKYRKPFIINSGFRSPEYNKKVGGSNNSLHTQCLAVDIKDNDGEIDNWFLEKKDLLIKESCAIESPRYTKNWCHFQVILPNSEKPVFKPYVKEPSKENYDKNFEELKDEGL